MTRLVIGIGLTVLALCLLGFSIFTSIGSNVYGALLPVGLALALLLAAVVTLRSRKNRL